MDNRVEEGKNTCKTAVFNPQQDISWPDYWEYTFSPGNQCQVSNSPKDISRPGCWEYAYSVSSSHLVIDVKSPCRLLKNWQYMTNWCDTAPANIIMRKIIGKITKIYTKSGWWNNHLLQNLIFMIQSCLDYQIPRKKERSRLAANVTIKPNLCENPTYTTNVTNNFHLWKKSGFNLEMIEKKRQVEKIIRLDKICLFLKRTGWKREIIYARTGQVIDQKTKQKLREDIDAALGRYWQCCAIQDQAVVVVIKILPFWSVSRYCRNCYTVQTRSSTSRC